MRRICVAVLMLLTAWTAISANEGSLRGDANHDGHVDVFDMNILINHILNVAEMDDLSICDMNGDSILDVRDLNMLINVILGANMSDQKETLKANGISFNMLPVGHGTFTLGAPDDDENPVHEVTLSHDFYMCETEVTQALWTAVMGSNPSYFKGDNLPVDKVSWEDCQAFIKKLNSLTGKNFRLPTEAEWEYCARGGDKSKGSLYSGGNDLDQVAWYSANSGNKPHPVATKKPNELGLYDMCGNVWEWCQDWYGPYSSDSQTDPTGPESAFYRIRRGGSWCNSADDCRVSARDYNIPEFRISYLGLRLVYTK